jgi:hypothetical protein
MNAFLTGSEVYGVPNVESDVDLVVRVDAETAKKLRELSDTPIEKNGIVIVRFGKLNLVLCEDDDQYAIWRLGTTQLMMRKEKSSKVVATEVFRELRQKVGAPDINPSAR